MTPASANEIIVNFSAISQSGNYTVVVANRSGNDYGSNSTPYPISVSPQPPTNTTTPANGSRCGTGPVTLSVSGAPSGGSYRWYAQEDATTAITGATGSSYITPSLTTTTTYYVATRNAAGCESTTRTAVTATINSIPDAPTNATTTANGSRCGTGSLTLSVSGAPSGGSYRWYAQEDATTAITGATGSSYITPSLTTTTTYYVAAVSAQNCESAIRTPVTATIQAQPSATIGTETSECDNPGGDNVFVLDGSIEDATSHTWIIVSQTPANIASITGEASLTPSVTFTQAGTAKVRLTASNTNGCSDGVAEIDLVVDPIPDAPTTISDEICGAGVVNLAVQNPVSGYSYRWYDELSDLAPVATTNGTFAPNLSSSNTYYVAAVNAQNCESTTRIPVTASILAQPSATIGAETSECDNPGGDNVFALDGSIEDATSHTWTIISQTPANIATLTGEASLTPSVTFTQAGTAKVRLTASNTNGCSDGVAEIDLVVDPIPDAPGVPSEPIVYCQFATNATALSASGTGLRWYTVETGGDPLSGAPIPSTITADDFSYWVSQTINGCESPRAEIVVSITDQPDEPGITNTVTYCQFAPNATALTATGTALKWYNANGDLLSGAPTPSTAVAGNTSYFVTQTVSGCESPRAEIVVSITDQPDEPGVTTPVPYCTGATASALSASGTALKWYDANGDLLSGAPTPSTAVAGNTSYFVTQTVAGCESPRAEIVVTVTDQPDEPGVPSDPITYCQGATPSTLTATGTALKWYNANGDLLSGAPTPSTAVAGNTSYFVTQTVAGCESPTAEIVVTINARPEAPTVFNGGNCGPGEITLRAEGAAEGDYRWYNPDGTPVTDENGNILTASQIIVSPPSIGNYRYRVSIFNGTCESTRVAVIASYYTPPTVSAGADRNICQNVDLSPVTFDLAGTRNARSELISWSIVASDATIQNVAVNINQADTLTSSATVSGYGNVTLRLTGTRKENIVCSVSDEVTFTVVQAVANNTITAPAITTICSGQRPGEIHGTTPTGGDGNYTYTWQRSYTSATDGFSNLSNSNVVNYTPAAISQRAWYRRMVAVNGCNYFSNAVEINVNPVISDNTIQGTQTVCSGAAIAALGQATNTTLSGGAGAGTYNYQWQSASTQNGTYTDIQGANDASYMPPTQNVTTSTTTYYRRVVTSGECSSTSTPVSVTISIPAARMVSGLSPTTTNVYFTGEISKTFSGGAPASGHTVSYELLRVVNGSETSVQGINNSTSGISIPLNLCTLGAGDYILRYSHTNTTTGCVTTTAYNIRINQSIYQVLVKANPHPVCPGTITRYTAEVYREAVIIYPYIANIYGQPVDSNNDVIPAGGTPQLNRAYFSEMSDAEFEAFRKTIIGANAWRFYQPKFVSGTRVTSGLTYQWTAYNGQNVNEVGVNSDYIENASLSATDWVGLKVNYTAQQCQTFTYIDGDRRSLPKSNWVFLGRPRGYQITLSPEPAYCSNFEADETITLTAAGGQVQGDWPSSDIWKDLNPELIWYRITTVNGAQQTVPIVTTKYGTSTEYSTSTNPFEIVVPKSMFQNGDQVYIDFNTSYEESPLLAGTGCIKNNESETERITITIDEPATITETLQLDDNEVCSGPGNVTYSVQATGTDLVFTWYKVGVTAPIVDGGNYDITSTTANGVTTSSLVITNPTTANSGSYYVVVDNSATVVCAIEPLSTQPLELTVNETPVVSLATRTVCELDEPFELNLGSFSPTNLNGTVEYSGIGVTENEDGTYTFNPATPGAGSITYTFTTANGCSSTTTAAAISVTPADEFDGALQVWLVENDDTKWELRAIVDQNTLPTNVSLDELTFEWYIQETTGGTPIPVNGWGDPDYITTVPSQIVSAGNENIRYRVVIIPPADECVEPLGIEIQDPTTPLPVEMIYFTAEVRGVNVMLEWATAKEWNNTGFEVQVSTDGHKYRKLAFVETKNGNGSHKQMYQYMDTEKGKSGTRYYRLKQIDVDTKFEYFGPVVVDLGSRNVISVSPNPFQDEFEVKVETETEGEVYITVTTAVGIPVMAKSVKVEKGVNIQQILVNPSLPSGIYIVTTRLNGTTKHFRLMKQ
ncbi:hypothetical protein D770_24050 [Flammeovirgaceae bacterium 311]|nr:hypothetical protein D770_24050 [Flammeovirgaceae bacterium 311]